MVKMHTTTEVAERLGLSSDRVLQAAKSLGIGQRFGKFFLFTEKEVLAIEARKGAMGRPAAEKVARSS